MESRFSKIKPLLIVIAALIILLCILYNLINLFSIFLYRHSPYPPNLIHLMGVLSIIPCILSIVGLVLKRKWAYFLTAMMLMFFGNFFIFVIVKINWSWIIFLFSCASYAMCMVFLFNKNNQLFFEVNSLKDIPISKLLIVSIVFLIICEIYIAKRYYYYQQVIFPPPVEQNAPQHKHWPFLVDSKIDNDDIKEILLLVNLKKPKSHIITEIRCLQDGSISVDVAEIRGPLDAEGFKYLFKYINGNWKLVKEAGWIS